MINFNVPIPARGVGTALDLLFKSTYDIRFFFQNRFKTIVSIFLNFLFKYIYFNKSD